MISSKPIWELERSTNALGRMKYVKKLKELIEIRNETIKFMEDGEEKDFEIKFIKLLKDRLSKYDIYNQKFNCQTCKEQVCICEEIFRGSELKSRRSYVEKQEDQDRIGISLNKIRELF